MNFMNLTGTKKETRKASFVLWAASLAILAQQPLHAAEEGEAGKVPTWKYADQSVSSDEILSMSEGTIGNFLSMQEITAESYQDVVTGLQQEGNDVIQTVTQAEALMQGLQIDISSAPDLLNDNLVARVLHSQAPYTVENEATSKIKLFDRLANNAGKLLRNKDRAERRKERAQRKALTIPVVQNEEK